MRIRLFLGGILLLLAFSLHDGYAMTNSQKSKSRTNLSLIETDSCKGYHFVYECDTLKQVVELSFLNKSKIKFNLQSLNKRRYKTVSIAGIAENMNPEFGASETDEDEGGNLYPVYEYIYEDACWLAFRLNLNRTQLRIKEADNPNPNPYCPFASVGALVPHE